MLCSLDIEVAKVKQHRCRPGRVQHSHPSSGRRVASPDRQRRSEAAVKDIAADCDVFITDSSEWDRNSEWIESGLDVRNFIILMATIFNDF